MHTPPIFRRDCSASAQGKSVLLSQILVSQETTACPTYKHYVSVYPITQVLKNPILSQAATTTFGVSSKTKAPKGMRWT